jgi:ketopantoate reductase
MKILVYGAGVIGTTYAWQFSNAGHDVSILVRKSKRDQIEKEGFWIRYRDERQKDLGCGRQKLFLLKLEHRMFSSP